MQRALAVPQVPIPMLKEQAYVPIACSLSLELALPARSLFTPS